jgi:hypothetical protein
MISIGVTPLLQPLSSTTVFGNDKHVAAFAQPDWTVKALSSYIDVLIEEDDED